MIKKTFLLLILFFIFLPSKVNSFWCGNGDAARWCDNRPYPGSCGHTGCGSCSGPDLHVNGDCCSWWCDPVCPTDNINACTSTCSGCSNSTNCPGHAPPPSGHCDSGCINQCGYRNADGSCTTNNACCHRVCSGGGCNTIAGGGTNECDNNDQCSNPPPPPPPPSGCNTSNLNMSYNPNPGNVGQSITFSMSGSEGSLFISDSFSGGVSNCSSGWPNTTCTVTSAGTYSWTHQYKVCWGSFDNCSDWCSKTINFSTINPCPAAQLCPTTCHTDTQYVANGSCGQTTCPPNAPTAQSCPTACHTNTQYVPNGTCGLTTCPPNNPPVQSCPTACHTNTQYVPNGTCGLTTCPPNNPPAQSCPTTCHTDTQTVPNGTCGLTTCPPNNPPAQSCPTTCHTDTQTVPNGSCGQITCPSNAPPAGTCPICRTTASSIPNGSCGTTPCPQNCWTTCVGDVCNSPPVFEEIILKDSISEVVNPESISGIGTSVNQICDIQFGDSRIVKFTIVASDPDGNSDITLIRLRFNGGTAIDSDSDPVNGRATFTLPDLANSTTLYNAEVFISDSHGSNTGWINTNRKLKMWDCLVPIIGTIYDGSGEAIGPSCNASSFTTPINNSINYSLIYHTDATNKNMDIASPNYSSNSSNHLTWGKTYNSIFDILGNVAVLKTTDLGNLSAGVVCPNPLLNLVLNNSHVNPYSTSPSIRADFSATMFQDPWFQASGGGVNSITRITDTVPITCRNPSCTPAISIDNSALGSNNSSLIVSANINKGCSSCQHGSPNNWSIPVSRSNFGDNYDYNYFYSKYLNSPELGITLPATTMSNLLTVLSTVGDTGVVLINGDFTIDTDNTVDPDKYLIIIAKNNISIGSSVTKVEGVFVADGAITAAGDSANPLQINGILYSSKNNVALTRSFTDKSENNSRPPVLVKYRPDFIFSLPNKLIQSSINWTQN